MYDNRDLIKMDERQSTVINSMRFPLIFLVVFVHMLPFEHNVTRLSWDMDEFYVLVSEMISHNLGRLAVPCFFLFSGYFFFKKFEGTSLKFFTTQFKKKWYSLVMPYLIWNLILIIAIFFKHHLFLKLGMGPDEKYALLQNLSLFELIWSMPINFPLWYIRDLICMVLLSPLFFMTFEGLKHFGLLLMALVYFGNFETYIPGFSTTALFFFGLGSYLALNHKTLLEVSRKYRLLYIVFFVITLISATLLNDSNYYEYIIRVFSLVGVFSLIVFFDFLNRYKIIAEKLINLAPPAFFIYVIHEVYILNWLKGAASRLTITNSAGGKLFMYFLVPTLCVFICIIIYKLLKKIIPSLLAFSLGGRLLPNISTQKGRGK